MNLLERLLGHDFATTQALLRLCLDLSDEQMDRVFDAGWGTLRKTFDHMMHRLGMQNLPEGDLMGWDQQQRLS